MVSIPASLIATFIGIYQWVTLNLMSLLGLSLVVGILVDDAIVVLENIYRHMEMGKKSSSCLWYMKLVEL
jgi:HAE1 family hydrophobic/amphiphilic exporter-1